MEIFKPPVWPILTADACTLFLAGSIEMGNCEDWQSKVAKSFEGQNVAIFNPRREDWDSSWAQTISYPQFKDQVLWELNHLETADVILMYLDPTTKAPISLMELGLNATKCIVVCCPDGFWRKGNVEVVCDHYNIPLYDDLDMAVKRVKSIITQIGNSNEKA